MWLNLDLGTCETVKELAACINNNIESGYISGDEGWCGGPGGNVIWIEADDNDRKVISNGES